MPTGPTAPHREAITPPAPSPWPSAWSLPIACPTEPPAGTAGATTAFSSPTPPSRTGWRRRGKKAEPQAETGYRDWALQDCAGYRAVDERYDGPCGVRSAVAGPNQRRLLDAIREHDPGHDDRRRFLDRPRSARAARGAVVRGITTDGSSLYPQPRAAVFSGVAHPVCAFHVRKELTQAVLRTRASIRKKRAAQAPKRPRGRPRNTARARRSYRRAQRIQRRVAELFEPRYRFVRQHLTPAERATLKRWVRGAARLKALRAIRDAV